MKTFRNVALLTTTVCVLLCSGQERFDSGWLKGFTKSPTEHIIVQSEKTFILYAVRGIVVDSHGETMSDVIVEIRDQQGRVIGTTTNSRGGFRFGRVAPGPYAFKITRNGFQSVVGKIVVSKQASRIEKLTLTMNVGV